MLKCDEHPKLLQITPFGGLLKNAHKINEISGISKYPELNIFHPLFFNKTKVFRLPRLSTIRSMATIVTKQFHVWILSASI